VTAQDVRLRQTWAEDYARRVLFRLQQMGGEPQQLADGMASLMVLFEAEAAHAKVRRDERFTLMWSEAYTLVRQAALRLPVKSPLMNMLLARPSEHATIPDGAPATVDV
jgi:hypothetical protein